MVADSKEILKTLAIKLHEIDAIKFGNFQTKSGLQTPIYFDLRVIISHPDVMVSTKRRHVFLLLACDCYCDNRGCNKDVHIHN